MALEKKVVTLPLQLGVDTKEAPALVDNSRFETLQNAVFDRGAAGELHLRNGYSRLPSADINANLLTNLQDLGTFNNELDLVANGNFYALAPAADAWLPHGPLPTMSLTGNAVNQASVSASCPDGVILNGIGIYAWQQSGTVYAKIVDAASQSVYQYTSGGIGSGMATYSNPKVVAISSTVAAIIASDSSGNVAYFSINTATPTASISGVTLASTGFVSTIFDACVLSSTLLLVYSTSTTLVANTFVGSTLQNSATVYTGEATTAVSCCVLGSDFFVAASRSDTKTYTIFYTSALSAINAHFAYSGTLASPPPRLTCVAYNASFVALFYEVNGNQQTINLVFMGISGIGSSGWFSTSVEIASQPWVQNGQLYLACVFPSTVQQTLFVLEQVSGEGSIVVAKLFNTESGPAPSNNRQPGPQGSGSSWTLLGTKGSFIVSQGGQPITIDGVWSVGLNFGSLACPSAQLGENLHLASGGLLYGYDGDNNVELGFNVFPEEPVVTFETSQLSVVVNVQDPTGANPQKVTIYVPDNGAQPGGPVGQLITPGEYITLNAATPLIASGSAPTPNQILIWFQVNGVGSAPTGSAYSLLTPVMVQILSSFTATQVATAISIQLATALNNYTVTYSPVVQGTAWTPQPITLVATSVQYGLSVPSLNRNFNVNQQFFGINGGTTQKHPSFSINCCPASLIKGGQYFTYWISNAVSNTGNIAPGYMWFLVAGTGSDPQPYAGLYNTATPPIRVTLTGNETEAQVAALVASGFTAAYPSSGGNIGVTAAQVGAEVSVTQVYDNNVVATNEYAQNPAIGGVAQGYVGQVVGGVQGAAVVEYSAVYEWLDGEGQLHQSAPSVPAVVYIPTYVNTTGGAAVQPNAVFSVSVQPLCLTQKATFKGAASDVDIAIYRTQSDQNLFYRVTSPTSLLVNTPDQPTSSLSFVDFAPDSPTTSTAPVTGIASNQALYTNGDVLENDGPPAASGLCNHQDRLWLIDAEDPLLLWPSFSFSPGLGVAFSQEQTQRLPAGVGQISGGNINAIASMDGNLIVLQENLLWFISGTGLDATNSGQPFSAPQLVASSTNVGCRDPGSVTLIPAGLVFKSNSGFYLLERGLSLKYIGAPVQAFNADVVTDAQAVSENTQVRFLSATGTTLVYDSLYDTWGTFTNHQGLASARLAGTETYVYINPSTSKILQETYGVYGDDGIGYPLWMQTAWLKFDGVQGFQRLWKILFKGNFPGTMAYQVSIAYNYNPTIIDTFTLNVGAGANANVWGGSATWGADSAWGYGPLTTLPNLLQFRVFNSKQLCESMQVTFQSLTPFDTTQTPGLDAIDLEIGIRKGAKRLGPTASIG